MADVADWSPWVSRLRLNSKVLRGVYEVPAGSARLTPMEGIRGLAVFMVFFVHLHAMFGAYLQQEPRLLGMLAALGDVGNVGVDLFFVLSGYLIYGALIRKNIPYLKFTRRRIQRIYPTFLTVFLFYLVLSLLFPSRSKIHGHFPHASLYVLQNLLLLPGIFNIRPIITVAWSLSYEFFFYLSIPLLIEGAKMRLWKRSARLGFFLLVWTSYLAYAFTTSHSEVRLLMFVSGILLFEAVDSGRAEGKLTTLGEVMSSCAFLLSLVFVYIYDMRTTWLSFLPSLYRGRSILPGVPSVQGPYKVIVLCCGCLVLALYSFNFNGFLARFFSWNPLRYLGNMSYSYYLAHGITLQGVAFLTARIVPAAGRGLFSYCLVVPLAFVATLVSSTILFALVERPMSLVRRSAARTAPIADADRVRP